MAVALLPHVGVSILVDAAIKEEVRAIITAAVALEHPDKSSCLKVYIMHVYCSLSPFFAFYEENGVE